MHEQEPTSEQPFNISRDPSEAPPSAIVPTQHIAIVRTPSVKIRAPATELPARRELMDEIELAKHLAVSRSTLQSWRYSGRGPRFIKLGRLVRYRNVDVDAFLASCVSSQCA